MTHTIVMPDYGQTTNEGTILRILKHPGEKISRGEHLVEVETDKVSVEVESYVSGYLRQVLVIEGQIVSAMAPIALVTDTLDEPVEPVDDKTSIAVPAAQPAIVAPPAVPPASRSAEATAVAPRAAAPSSAGLSVAPAAKALAKELGIDLNLVPGTGPGGLITRKDVERYANSTGKTPERANPL
jgi:pyruvate dehydrogenase E2 component (dihydrolipoamide acetyltransferase)